MLFFRLPPTSANNHKFINYNVDIQQATTTEPTVAYQQQYRVNEQQHFNHQFVESHQQPVTSSGMNQHGYESGVRLTTRYDQHPPQMRKHPLVSSRQMAHGDKLFLEPMTSKHQYDSSSNVDNALGKWF